MSKQRYSREFKLEAVKLVTEQGQPKAEVARRLGVTGKTISDWVKQLADETTPVSAPESEELNRLREENRQLRMEREILKKATAFFANPDR